jgi:hypothetical protein
MDNPLTPDEQNIALEDALRTYPVAAMPRDLSLDVMKRIRAVPASPLFHVMWSDFALSLVIALSIAAVWFAVNQLPPLVIVQIRKESILLYQHILVNARTLIPVLFFSLAGLLSALTIPYLSRELVKKSM